MNVDRAARHRSRRMPAAGNALAALVLATVANLAGAQQLPLACGSLSNGFGPFDYRTDIDRRAVVELNHFTPEIEMLIRGRTGTVGADLDYTLRAFPNHHRALVALMRLSDATKLDRVPGANFSVQCYFARSLQFRPDDTTVRMLYAIWLNGRQRRDEALTQLAVTRTFAGDNGFTHYNLGMVYMDIGEPKRALEQAHTALSLGFARPELRQRLEAAKEWRDPDATPEDVAGSASSPAVR